MIEAKPIPTFRVALMGVDSVTQKVIDASVPRENQVVLPYDLEKVMEMQFAVMPNLVIVGPGPSEGEKANLIEVAQVLRMQFQNEPIYFITSLRQNFDRKSFQKNGFSDAFLLPIDTDTVICELKEMQAKASNGGLKVYREVKLIDLQPGQTLDFNTYLYMPMNKKHIPFSSEGDEIDQDRFERIKRNKMSSMHVSSDQMKTFYAFAAKQLKSLQNGKPGISETERKERMTQAIRGLVAGVFSDNGSDATIEGGRGIINDCQEIVKEFIVGEDAKNNWYTKIMAITGAESGSYNHAGNVATFAALFSMAIGAGKTEDIALAGLLHDLGLADVPADIQAKSEEERTLAEQEEYKKHVEHTLNLIKFRKLILNDNVTKAIHQHHERWSGTGYPRGLAGTRICIEAQILALADTFDEMTITKEGKARMSPAEAFRKIYEETLNNSAMAQFDLELLQKFMAVFPEEAVAA